MSDESRRKLLKSIAAGSGAIVAGKSLPDSWSRPVVDSVLLPAHALTSLPVICNNLEISGFILECAAGSNALQFALYRLVDDVNGCAELIGPTFAGSLPVGEANLIVIETLNTQNSNLQAGVYVGSAVTFIQSICPVINDLNSEVALPVISLPSNKAYTATMTFVLTDPTNSLSLSTIVISPD